MNSFDITQEKENNKLKNILFKTFQSCNLNFLLGAGTSYPAIATLGNIENEVQELMQNEEIETANLKLFEFLMDIYENALKIYKDTDGSTSITKENYLNFISWLNKILLNRKNDITESSANIFTTNYDLFLEYACERQGNYFNFNDGFSNKNKIFSKPLLNVSEFNKRVNYSTNLYKHHTILPNINIVKLHGSLNWKVEESSNDIALSDVIDIYSKIFEPLKGKKISKTTFTKEKIEIINTVGIIMPTKEKFKRTVLEESYYNFLRYFSNELERENCILFTIGFSFADEHIRDLVIKALSINPTLQLYINVFNQDCYNQYEEFFKAFRNVTLIYNSKTDYKFEDCYNLLNDYFKGLENNERQ